MREYANAQMEGGQMREELLDNYLRTDRGLTTSRFPARTKSLVWLRTFELHVDL
jgi:hypothetical protein